MICYERTAFYYETDQMGIVHHSNYIRWMEEARIHMLSKLGLNYKKMEDLGIMIPVLNVQCDYKIPVRFNDTVLITPILKSFNGIKFSVSYTIRQKETGVLSVSAVSGHCFLDSGFHPIRLKKNFPEVYDTFLKAVEP